MSRFTILGGHGNIGQRLRAYIEGRGYEVWIPTRGDEAVFQRNLGHVIYAIGVTADFRTRPFETMDAHVCVLANVLSRARFESLLYLSSTRVYSGNEAVDEMSPLSVQPADPSDLYNLSKLAGESLCLQSGRDKVRVARLSNVVGADDQESANFLPSLTREARNGLIRLRSDMRSAKDYVHIDDVVPLLTQIALTARDRIYNVASGKNITHEEWVRELQRTHRCSVEVETNAPVLRFPPIAIRRVVDEFGFSPRDVLRTILP